MAKNTAPNQESVSETTAEPVVIANAPSNSPEVDPEVVGNPPKMKTNTGEISAAEASGAQRTREEELGKKIPNNTPMATPEVVKQVVVAGISGEELVQVKPTKPGPFKIGPKYWRFQLGQTYSVPNFVKQVLARANALAVL